MADRRIARSTSVKGMELLNLPLCPLIVLSFFNGTCLYCPGPGVEVGREHEENTMRAGGKGKKKEEKKSQGRDKKTQNTKQKQVYNTPGIFFAVYIFQSTSFLGNDEENLEPSFGRIDRGL